MPLKSKPRPLELQHAIRLQASQSADRVAHASRACNLSDKGGDGQENREPAVQNAQPRLFKRPKTQVLSQRLAAVAEVGEHALDKEPDTIPGMGSP